MYSILWAKLKFNVFHISFHLSFSLSFYWHMLPEFTIESLVQNGKALASQIICFCRRCFGESLGGLGRATWCDTETLHVKSNCWMLRYDGTLLFQFANSIYVCFQNLTTGNFCLFWQTSIAGSGFFCQQFCTERTPCPQSLRQK